MAGNDPVLALLPSPLLGPATWTPVAERLRAAGRRVVVCSWDGPLRSPEDVLASFVGQLPIGPVVLVAHSNAGAFVPTLSARCDVAAAVFVDAVLPGAEPQPMAPPGALDFLRGLADDDGLQPVWTDWWDPAEVTPLFPDDETRRRVTAEQRRLPASYFESSIAVPAGWSELPAAYLAFGDTYGPEFERADLAGWPVHRMAGLHLHQLVAPDAVAAVLDNLLAELSYPSA